MTALLVTLAGAAGVLARYGLGTAVHSAWTIVAINVAGSFALGLLVASGWGSQQARLALGTGFLGGFTTFSTYAVETHALLRPGSVGTAFGYLAGTMVGALVAVVLGVWLTRWVTRRRGGAR